MDVRTLSTDEIASNLDNWTRVSDNSFVHVNPADNQTYEIRIVYYYDKDPLEWATADLYCTYPSGECLCLLANCVVKDILDYVETFCKQKNDLTDAVRKEILQGLRYPWEMD